jgi:hypothetical protein
MTKKAIDPAEFQTFSETVQLDILHRDGVYVGKLVVNGQITILFQLYAFYVEVQYKLYRQDINRLLATDNPDILTPYLNQIDIDALKKKPDVDAGDLPASI